MGVQHRERRESQLSALLCFRLLRSPASGEEAEAQAADARHDVCLLENQPLEDVRAVE